MSTITYTYKGSTNSYSVTLSTSSVTVNETNQTWTAAQAISNGWYPTVTAKITSKAAAEMNRYYHFRFSNGKAVSSEGFCFMAKYHKGATLPYETHILNASSGHCTTSAPQNWWDLYGNDGYKYLVLEVGTSSTTDSFSDFGMKGFTVVNDIKPTNLKITSSFQATAPTGYTLPADLKNLFNFCNIRITPSATFAQPIYHWYSHSFSNGKIVINGSMTKTFTNFNTITIPSSSLKPKNNTYTLSITNNFGKTVTINGVLPDFFTPITPSISNLVIKRKDSNEQQAEISGTYIIDQKNEDLYNSNPLLTTIPLTITINDNTYIETINLIDSNEFKSSNNFSFDLNETFDVDTSYNLSCYIEDNIPKNVVEGVVNCYVSSTYTDILSTAFYILDIAADGKGIGIGTAGRDPEQRVGYDELTNPNPTQLNIEMDVIRGSLEEITPIISGSIDVTGEAYRFGPVVMLRVVFPIQTTWIEAQTYTFDIANLPRPKINAIGYSYYNKYAIGGFLQRGNSINNSTYTIRFDKAGTRVNSGDVCVFGFTYLTDE